MNGKSRMEIRSAGKGAGDAAVSAAESTAATSEAWTGASPTSGMNSVELLQQLIRFETVNPPGNEVDCILFIAELLREAGFAPILLSKSPQRPNLVVRFPGTGVAPPFLMYGHADVVTAEGQQWTRPPFAGVESDGYVWGRGALDMKSGLVMMISALLRLKRERFTPAGDIILSVVCDEEDGGTFGARFLATEHADLFQGVRYAISELGGFSMDLAGRRFYPIMVTEKQRCSLRVRIAGPGGHGSLARRGGAMAGLAKVLHRMERRHLPVRLTPPVRMMLDALAASLPFPARLLPWLLSYPTLAAGILPFLGSRQGFFQTLFRNTVSPTIVRGGEVINVVPSEIQLELDGRLLPGLDPLDLLGEVQQLLGSEADVEISYFSPGPADVDLGLFGTLAEILREQDPDGHPVPFVGSGVSDARHFCKLGIQTYGFTPMILPQEIDFSALIHGADERIPVAALEFGVEAVYRLLKRL